MFQTFQIDARSESKNTVINLIFLSHRFIDTVQWLDREPIPSHYMEFILQVIRYLLSFSLLKSFFPFNSFLPLHLQFVDLYDYYYYSRCFPSLIGLGTHKDIYGFRTLPCYVIVISVTSDPILIQK